MSAAIVWAARCSKCGWFSVVTENPAQLPEMCPECGHKNHRGGIA